MTAASASPLTDRCFLIDAMKDARREIGAVAVDMICSKTAHKTCRVSRNCSSRDRFER